jgi:heme oxygenase
MTDTAPTLSQRLKTECWPLHEAAEHAALPKKLISATVTRDEYVGLLHQTLLHTAALDEALRRRLADLPALGAVVEEAQLQAPLVERDLEHLGADPAGATASPATRELLDRIERFEAEDPIRLLGLHYVREGAHNGNRFIARSIQKALGLPAGGDGVRHLTPYGDEQPAVWASFKATLDAQRLTDEQRDAIVDAAKDMFRAITAIHAQIASAEATPASY